MKATLWRKSWMTCLCWEAPCLLLQYITWSPVMYFLTPKPMPPSWRVLGSTNLYPTAAHMETFSTSVFKVTMAAGTRLVLQLVLVKRFKLYSFQLQDYKKGLGNLHACCLTWMWAAVSQAPSPESNPNSPSPVAIMVSHYLAIDS